MRIRPVEDDQWSIVAWLWQCFRHDLAPAVSGLPYADGRYQTRGLPDRHTPDVATYLGWKPHPKTHRPAPVGFAVVDGLTGDRRSLAALWVAPVVRHEGVGMELALHAIGRHPGPWAMAFQHDNPAAARFWRRAANAAFGSEGWREDQREVTGVPDAPPDHWIEST
jgi:hypothetical protein